jgi:hypothetical protein
MASSYSIISTQNKSQLLDPFYKKVTTTVAKNPALQNPSFPTIVNNPNDILPTIKKESQTHPSVNTPRRQQKYTQMPNTAALLRMRAYENAYFEFKKDIREENGDDTNYGKHISVAVGDRESYLGLVGFGAGTPYCASFITWCYYYSGWKDLVYKIVKGEKVWTNKGGSLAAAQTWGKEGLLGQNGMVKEISPRQVEAGDPVVFGLAISGTDNDHVGMFSQWLVKPWENGGIGLFSTIEGNTTPDVSVARDGKTFKIVGWPNDPNHEGVYGKKHTYNMNTGMDDIISKKDITFARVVI